MHRTINVALGGAALTLGAVVALPGVALAQEKVDCGDKAVAAKYPDLCVDKPGKPITGGTESGGIGSTPAAGAGTVTGGTTNEAGTASTGGGGASSLPFTGDEVLVLSLAGAGALGAGVALAAAGRRRRTTSA